MFKAIFAFIASVFKSLNHISAAAENYAAQLNSDSLGELDVAMSTFTLTDERIAEIKSKRDSLLN